MFRMAMAGKQLLGDIPYPFRMYIRQYLEESSGGLKPFSALILNFVWNSSRWEYHTEILEKLLAKDFAIPRPAHAAAACAGLSMLQLLGFYNDMPRLDN